MTQSQEAKHINLDIEDTVTEIEEIIQTLEEGDVSISKATELRERGESLIEHLKDETELNDGALNRIEDN